MNTPFLEYELLSPETADPVFMRISRMSKKSFPAFIASNGIILQPLCHLAWVSCDEFDKLYLPGEGCGGNEAPIPLDDWPAVKQAIGELNEHYKEKNMKEDRYEFDMKEWEYNTEPEPFETTGPARLIVRRKKPRVKVEWRKGTEVGYRDYGNYCLVQFRVTGHMDKAHLHYDTGRGIMFFVRPRYNTTRYNTYESMTDDVTIAQDAFSKWSAPVLLPESIYSKLDDICRALENRANEVKG